MNGTWRLAIVFAAGLALGAGTLRLAGTPAAFAQEAVPAPAATASMPMPMPMGPDGCANAGSMPMHGQGMMQGQGPMHAAMMDSMMQMHHSMSAVVWTGDADRDFAMMMIPHQLGTIAMAQAELKYGKDPTLLATAREIVSTQGKEVVTMKAFVAKSGY